jgi:hypothetical protein
MRKAAGLSLSVAIILLLLCSSAAHYGKAQMANSFGSTIEQS